MYQIEDGREEKRNMNGMNWILMKWIYFIKFFSSLKFAEREGNVWKSNPDLGHPFSLDFCICIGQKQCCGIGRRFFASSFSFSRHPSTSFSLLLAAVLSLLQCSLSAHFSFRNPEDYSINSLSAGNFISL
jgi:hypothetical protein